VDTIFLHFLESARWKSSGHQDSSLAFFSDLVHVTHELLNIFFSSLVQLDFDHELLGTTHGGAVLDEDIHVSGGERFLSQYFEILGTEVTQVAPFKDVLKIFRNRKPLPD